MSDDDTEDPSQATCDGCGKTVACGEDEEEPAGWWALLAERGLADGTGEEDSALVCSPGCAKLWLEGWGTEQED